MRRLLLILALFPMIQSQSSVAVSPIQTPPTPASVQAAVERALPLLRVLPKEFVSKRTCFSCHHNALPILTLHMAQARGIAIDKSILSTVKEITSESSCARCSRSSHPGRRIERSHTQRQLPDDGRCGRRGLEHNLTLSVHAQQLLGWQQPDGHWVTSDFRPPHSSSVFTATATAVRAIRFYAPEELNTRTQMAVKSARDWLRKTHPVSTEDAAFRLAGLVWAGTTLGKLPTLGWTCSPCNVRTVGGRNYTITNPTPIPRERRCVEGRRSIAADSCLSTRSELPADHAGW